MATAATAFHRYNIHEETLPGEADFTLLIDFHTDGAVMGGRDE